MCDVEDVDHPIEPRHALDRELGLSGDSAQGGRIRWVGMHTFVVGQLCAADTYNVPKR